MSESVMMSELSWPEYKHRIEEEDAIILLPVGAVEQHRGEAALAVSQQQGLAQ